MLVESCGLEEVALPCTQPTRTPVTPEVAGEWLGAVPLQQPPCAAAQVHFGASVDAWSQESCLGWTKRRPWD